jgi:hypothetical protein
MLGVFSSRTSDGTTSSSIAFGSRHRWWDLWVIRHCGLLVKFYAGEEDTEDELRAQFEGNGLEAGRLEREGRLLMRPEEGPLGGSRDGQLERLAEKAEQGCVVWASFNKVGPPVESQTVPSPETRPDCGAWTCSVAHGCGPETAHVLRSPRR